MDMDDPTTSGSSSRASLYIGIGLVGLLAVAGGVYLLARPEPAVAPEATKADPLLRLGQEVYQERCVSCHGLKGTGDGPMAKGLSGPPPGNLSDGEWKHGSRPDQVLTVIRDGVPQTGMLGFGRALNERQLLAVAGFVYTLAGQEMPPEVRKGAPAPSKGP